MRLLTAVPNSVLWLSSSNEWVPANLMKEARARGVDPSRLIFAPRMNAFEHALYLLAWLREVFPGPPRVLWVAAHNLEHLIYPTFLTVTELPAHPWKTVAAAQRLNGSCRPRRRSNRGISTVFDIARAAHDYR